MFLVPVITVTDSHHGISILLIENLIGLLCGRGKDKVQIQAGVIGNGPHHIGGDATGLAVGVVFKGFPVVFINQINRIIGLEISFFFFGEGGGLRIDGGKVIVVEIQIETWVIVKQEGHRLIELFD